jgi:glycosyltransferase involved in cell wall biosynthesis
LIDLLIVPSQYEGFGLTAAEAMAAGLPVIASDVDGLREVVDDGNSGLLVPFGDVEKMSSALLALLSNPERARSMGKNGKLRIEKLFSVAIFHNAIVDAYAQL